MIFTKSIELPTSSNNAFAYHARPGALQRLIPPWESVSIVRSSASIESGSEVLLRTWLFGKRLDWLARHEIYQPPVLFSDLQVYGPFAAWRHRHEFVAMEEHRCLLTDSVDYTLPLGWLGKAFGSTIAKEKIERMFCFRHRQTADDLTFGDHLQREIGEQPKVIAISGSTGLIGKSICSLLTVLGHHVVRLVRFTRSEASVVQPTANDHSVVWDPNRGLLDPSQLEGVDAVIHLAGQGIGDRRWSQQVKSELTSSRVHATRVLAEQLAKLKKPPTAFVSASGIGIYGSTGDELVSEEKAPSDDFLGKLAAAWEEASAPLASSGTKRCFGRLGIVLDPRSGALSKMLPLIKSGLGGDLGSGKQQWSWISREDAASAFIWLALNPSCSGPYNLVSGSISNHDFTKTIATLLHRPTLLPAPAFALRLAMGEMADSLLLASTRASNQKLLDSGFTYRNSTLEDACRHVLGIRYS